MTATEPQSTGPRSTARLFAGLVPDEVSAAYQKLLDAGGVPKQEAPEFVGGTEIMESLSKLGMAHVSPHTPASPAMFQPAPPDLALEGVLADLQFRLLRGHELLLDGHRRLSLVQSECSNMAKLPEHMVHVTTDRQQILELTRYLINTVHQDWMTLESVNIDMPLTEDYAIDGPPAIREQARIRSIYDRAFTEHPLGVKMIRACVAAGEQARVLPRIPMKMQLADTTAVLLPLTPTGTGGALLIRARPIVTAMRDYFELLWEKATPFGSTRAQQISGVTPAERAILELLNQGMQDAAIARQLGTSQSTVRRHITAMTSRLKVNSRFAFGAAAQRRGWLD